MRPIICHRNLRDVTNSGSEADLYGLVSTILDDADPLDSDLCQELVFFRRF